MFAGGGVATRSRSSPKRKPKHSSHKRSPDIVRAAPDKSPPNPADSSTVLNNHVVDSHSESTTRADSSADGSGSSPQASKKENTYEESLRKQIEESETKREMMRSVFGNEVSAEAEATTDDQGALRLAPY